MSEFEDPKKFESRKQDHIKWSLDERSQVDLFPSSVMKLSHHPFPDLNLDDVTLVSSSRVFHKSKPFLVSSMTGGHEDAVLVNRRLAKASEEKNWIFAAGSMRKEVEALAKREDVETSLKDWLDLRRLCPNLKIMGNLGLAQLISIEQSHVHQLIEALQLEAFFIHLNPLQEALQEEGTPQFKGGAKALKRFCEDSKVPVVLKETGSGFSRTSLVEASKLLVSAVDVAGLGGTHWGRVEGLRSSNGGLLEKASIVFQNWGETTLQSLCDAQEVLDLERQEAWASGGLRSGLDAAICFAIGAKFCGFAKPLMKAALDSEKAILDFMNQIEFETKLALFCTNSKDIKTLQEKSSEVLEWL